MSIEDLGNIGDFVGGIAVLISIVYLSVQIRHNTREVVHASTQSLLGKSIEVFSSTLATPLPGILAKLENAAELSAEEQQYFRIWLRRNLQLFELVYLQYREGRVTREIMNAYEVRILGHTSRPQWSAEWATLRPSFTKRFGDYVDALIAARNAEG